MKRKLLVLLTVVLILFPIRAWALSPSQAYADVYGVSFPFTPSPRADSYTFTIYEGSTADPASLLMQKTLSIPTAQTVFLTFDYDLTQRRQYLLTVSANVQPQRQGLDAPFTREYPFEAGVTCGHPEAPGAFLAGDGSSENPYRVGTPQQLDHVREHLSACFRQTAHIDLSGWPTPWQPLSVFTGTYDGDGYTISHIPFQNIEGFSLFGQLSGATVRRLGLTGLDFYSPTGVTLGALAGTTENSFISECFLRDSSIGGVDNNNGALAGNVNNSTLERCYAAHVITQGRHVGAFAGHSSGAVLNECFAIPDKITFYSYGRGTLVGWDNAGNDQFSGCYYSNDTAPGVAKGAVGWYMRSGTYNYDPAGTLGLPLGSFSSLSNLPGLSGEYWEVREGAEYPTLRCERPLTAPQSRALQSAPSADEAGFGPED